MIYCKTTKDKGYEYNTLSKELLYNRYSLTFCYDNISGHWIAYLLKQTYSRSWHWKDKNTNILIAIQRMYRNKYFRTYL